MDYKAIEFLEDRVVIKGVKNFNIEQTIECGQCFRWDKVSEKNYIIVAFEKVLEIEQKDDVVTLSNTNKKDFEEIWHHYFNLDRDYDEIKEILSKDKILKDSIEYGYGIRLLNQEAFELLISFIISARNSIPMIKKTILEISKRWGKEIEYKGNIYYTFPTAEILKDITELEMKDAGGSFRSRYIVGASKSVFEDQDNIEGKFNLERIIALNDDECHKALQEFMGVGAKVADCIMLFSMGKTSAFPVDRWVQRAMMHFYGAEEMSLPKIRVFGRELFGEYSGFAQQYLFFYALQKGIKL